MASSEGRAAEDSALQQMRFWVRDTLFLNIIMHWTSTVRNDDRAYLPTPVAVVPHLVDCAGLLFPDISCLFTLELSI